MSYKNIIHNLIYFSYLQKHDMTYFSSEQPANPCKTSYVLQEPIHNLHGGFGPSIPGRSRLHPTCCQEPGCAQGWSADDFARYWLKMPPPKLMNYLKPYTKHLSILSSHQNQHLIKAAFKYKEIYTHENNSKEITIIISDRPKTIRRIVFRLYLIGPSWYEFVSHTKPVTFFHW